MTAMTAPTASTVVALAISISRRTLATNFAWSASVSFSSDIARTGT